MKPLYKTLILAAILVLPGTVLPIGLPGQVLMKTGTGTIERTMSKGSVVTVEVRDYRGTLQWQKSDDGTGWTDLPGKTNAQLQWTANESSYLRVGVKSENCDTVYSGALHITVQAGPVVVTLEISGIAATEAYSGGEVTSDNGKTVTEQGICWATTENPTVDDNQVIDELMEAGTFISYLNGLDPEKTYYVRAYAVNADGTGYGNQLSFTTMPKTGSFTDGRDSRSYKWVFIGSQKWMSENLAWLPAVSPAASDSKTEKIYYVHGYNGTDVAAAKATPNYTLYGALYNWPACMDGAASSSTVPSGVKGACPEGWHLPSALEWGILRTYLVENGYGYGGSGFDIGKSLASDTLWAPTGVAGQVGNDIATNNRSGFNGLPAGGRDYPNGGTFIGLLEYAFFLSATECNADNMNTTGLTNIIDYFRWSLCQPGQSGGYGKNAGMSVRCLKD